MRSVFHQVLSFSTISVFFIQGVMSGITTTTGYYVKHLKKCAGCCFTSSYELFKLHTFTFAQLSRIIPFDLIYITLHYCYYHYFLFLLKKLQYYKFFIPYCYLLSNFQRLHSILWLSKNICSIVFFERN